MMEQKSSVIERIKEGDKAAFTDLFRSYYPRIHGFLVGLLKDRELAEEVTQDVFFRFWLNREQLDVNLSFESYLFSISKNIVLNIYKKREVEQRYLDSRVFAAEETSGTEEHIYYKELNALIDDAVKDMPAQQRLIFRMSRMQGLLNAEIAEQLHISKRTVEKHISNSLQTLRKVITNNYYLFFL